MPLSKVTTTKQLAALQAEVAELRERVERLERPIGRSCIVCHMSVIEIAIAEGVPRDIIEGTFNDDGVCRYCAHELQREAAAYQGRNGHS